MSHSDSILYYHDADGYLLPNSLGAAGATVEPPPALTTGKTAQWNTVDWVIVNIPAAAGTAGNTGTVGDASAMEDLPQVIVYNGDGTVSSVVAGPDATGASYIQTFGYTGGNLTSVSAWVKQ